ncbi:MAG: winged helix-turn-helix domain-containing protein [Myxococcales bacterium]|nr:winged helix-turn-helix domain-containing protein [Myxococcales bacterium]
MGGQLDLDRRVMHRADGPDVPLTDLETRLLSFVAARGGQAVGRHEIHQALWPVDSAVRRVDDCVRRVRRKIEVNPGQPDHLRSVWGVGYTFTRADAEQATSTPRSSDVHIVALGPQAFVNLTAHEVVRGTQRTALTANEVALLTVLAEQRGRPVDRQVVVRKVFGLHGDRALENLVRRLRAKIEEVPSSPVHLLTVRGRGFRLESAAPLRPEVPRPLSRFIGRASERERVRRALADGTLVTLTGPAGVGKTRLALAAAADWAGPVAFCPLASVEDGAGLLDAVAACLGLRLSECGGSDIADRLAWSPNTLLVLDGFEHLVQHAAVLAAWTTARILVTSRRPLPLRGATRVLVEPLPVVDAVELLRDRSPVELDEAQIEPLSAIAETLDRLPLALELAAQWLPVLRPEQLAQRLGKAGGRGLPDDEARTLYDAIARSWELLEPGSRVGILRMSVGPWLRSAVDAEVLLEGLGVPPMRILRDLCEVGLLAVVSTDEGTAYRAYDAVRRFCRDQDGWEDAVAQHARAYATLGATEALHGVGRRDSAQRCRRIAFARAPLRAAAEWGLAQGCVEVVVSATRALLRSAVMTGHGQSVLDLSAEVLRRIALTPTDRAELLESRWDLLLVMGQRALLGQDLPRLEALAEELAQARLSAVVARCRVSMSLATEADCADAIRLAASAGDLVALARAHHACGLWMSRQGRSADADEHHRGAVQLHREAGDMPGLGLSLMGLGAHMSALGHPDEAIACIEEAIETLEGCGYRRATALGYLNLGALTFMQGSSPEEAVRCFEHALQLYQDLCNPRHVAMTHINLGDIWLEQGELERAEVALRRGLALGRQGADHQMVGGAMASLARIAHQRGDSQHAMASLKTALALQGLDDRDLLRILGALACVAAGVGARERAVDALGRGEALVASQSPLVGFGFLLDAVRAWVELGEIERARAVLQRAESLRGQMTFRLGGWVDARLDDVRQRVSSDA